MKSKAYILCAAILAAVFACASCTGGYVRMDGFTQGGTYSVTCKVPSGVEAQKVSASVDSLLQGIEASLSGYSAASLLSRINDGERLPLDEHLLNNYIISLKVWQESNGAFDPSAAPLFDLWGFGFKHGETPSLAAVDSIMQFVGMQHFALDTIGDQIFLRKDDPRCRLNFNAVAQGYSCDAVAALLRRSGVNDFLVEIGGEIFCSGESPRGGLWSIGVERPEGSDENIVIKDTLQVSNCGVVTSGNYRKHNGSKGHIIDPRTGQPSEGALRAETVIVDESEYQFPTALADARATVAVLLCK